MYIENIKTKVTTKSVILVVKDSNRNTVKVEIEI